jgi:hypothetical protein
MKKIELSSTIINKEKRKLPEKTDSTSSVNSSKDFFGKPPEKKKTPRKSIFKRFFGWYQELGIFKKILFTGLVSLFIVGSGGAAGYFFLINSANRTSLTIPSRVTAQAPTSTQYLVSINSALPNAPKDTPNPIDGELFTAKEVTEMKARYPLAVMIENHVDARNQSCFNSADIVFETLAEGGITRMMGIFWGHTCTEIGPVRSARQYFIEWLMPYDPLYMHIGCASSSDPRTNACGNIYNNHIKTMDRAGTFWRSTAKYAPHNAYTSSELLYQKAQTAGYTGAPKDIPSLKFKKDNPYDQRGEQTTATIVFFKRLNNDGLYDVIWTYDRNRNVYLRSGLESPYLDQTTGEQVFAKTVAIHRVNFESTYDSKAHVIVTTIGEGDAIILMDGHVIYGKWKKDDINSVNRYFDQDGNEISLNRGRIWVMAVPSEDGSVEVKN